MGIAFGVDPKYLPRSSCKMKPFRRKLCLFLILATLSIGHAAIAGPEATPAPVAVSLSGKVLETMDGGGYTYVHLKNGNDKVWVAIPLMKVSVGQELTLLPGYEFKNFNSKGLNRKFDRLIFSAGPPDKTPQLSPSALKMAHQGVPKNDKQAAAPVSPAPTPAPAQVPASAVNKNTKSGPISIEQVAKAKGPNAYTIAQLYAKKSKLEKKPVVVRGRVVKVTTRIMKRNWIHIKDGSGSQAKKNNELVITTTDLPKEGDLVTAKGVLYNNIDFGSGYRYSLIMQGAQVR
jgi:hypothetical protein